MNKMRLLVIGGVLLIVLSLVTAVWTLPPLGTTDRPPADVTTLAASTVTTHIRKINLNTASAAQLSSALSISETLAQKIVEFRGINGGFSSLFQLTAIDGISESRVRKWEKYLSLSDENT